MKNKKFILVCLLSSITFTLTGCNETKIPEVSNGKDTVVTELKGKPTDNDAKNVVFATLGKLDSYQSYVKKSTNHVSAKKGVINYDQNSTATMIKNVDEYYVDSTSKSAFVDMEHIAFSKNDKVAYQDKGGEIKNSNYKDYFSVYGVTPNKLLSGQIFNQETILLASLKESNNNTYTYTLILDMNKANDLIAHQTQVFGGLNALPSYLEHTEFILTIDGSYKPISYSYSTKYTINVNVLGDLTCTETCTASFEKFNETIEIPNADALNKAINETPTKVDVVEPVAMDENLNAIVNALLDYDFENGVSLNGTANVKSVKMPLKVATKIDFNSILKNGLDGIMSKIDFSINLNLPIGETKISYHDNAFYVSALNTKTKFSVRNSDDDSDSKIDTEGLFAFTKEGDSYVISLSPYVKAALFSYLVQLELFEENDSDKFVAQIEFYILEGNLGTIKGIFGLKDDPTASFNFLIGNEAYETIDYSEYSTKLNLSMNGSLSLYCMLAKDGTLSLPYEINLNYDDSAPSFLEAVSIDFNTSLSSVSALLSAVTSYARGVELPDIISVLAKCEHTSILLRNGKLYVAGFDVIDGNYALKAIQELSTSSLSNISLSDSVKNLLGLILKYGFSRGVESSKLAREIFIEFTKLIAGTDQTFTIGMTVMLCTFLGFNNPIKCHQISIEEDGVYFSVIGYKVETKSVYNPAFNSTYETVQLFSFALSNSDIEISTDKLTELVSSTNLEMASSVDPLVTEYKYLSNSENYSIEDSYFTRLNDLDTKFAALTVDKDGNDIENVVTYAEANGLTKENIDSLKTTAEKNKNAVTDFVDSVLADSPDYTALNKQYKTFKAFQISYLKENYASAYQAFYELSLTGNATNIQKTKDKITALEDVDLTTLNETNLKKRISTLVSLRKEALNYLDGTIDSESIAVIDSYLSKAANYYVEYKINEFGEKVDLSTLAVSDLVTRLSNIASYENNTISSYKDFVSADNLSKLVEMHTTTSEYFMELCKKVFDEDFKALNDLEEETSIDKFVEVYNKVRSDFNTYFMKFNSSSYNYVIGDRFNEFYYYATILNFLSIGNSYYKYFTLARPAVFAIEKAIDGLVNKIASENLSDDDIKNSEEIKTAVESINALRKIINLDTAISNLDQLTAIEEKLN